MIKRTLIALGLVGVTVQAIVTVINLVYHWRPDRSYELAGLGPGRQVSPIASLPQATGSHDRPNHAVVNSAAIKNRGRPGCNRLVERNAADRNTSWSKQGPSPAPCDCT